MLICSNIISLFFFFFFFALLACGTPRPLFTPFEHTPWLVTSHHITLLTGNVQASSLGRVTSDGDDNRKRTRASFISCILPSGQPFRLPAGLEPRHRRSRQTRLRQIRAVGIPAGPAELPRP
ncbi:hypothetical protein GGR52DRAFT_161527 [Hypoxylon sp. FL1284]|nr:hypothetical protein GGR52DRAFT_161527 [Hypoxylon sp. FL1284]